MHTEADVVEGIMRNRTLIGVENQCRYYVPPGQPPSDRGPSHPGCHWYLAINRTTPWALQKGLPGAGSEFAWDTTGQEEAYIWGAWFAKRERDGPAADLATSALDQILAYTPLVPNWAYHGSALGFGDFGNNGYVRFDGGNERVLQHYRSGLNAIPTAEAFLTSSPPDLYLLRLAAGSIGGVLANIDASGANSMGTRPPHKRPRNDPRVCTAPGRRVSAPHLSMCAGFHADPANLFYDPASGDWGLALYGHTHITASFLVDHPDLGIQCYFCDVRAKEAAITLTPRDSYRRRVFISQLGLDLISDAGIIAQVDCLLNPAGGGAIVGVRVSFAPIGDQPLRRFRLRLITRAGGRAFSLKGFPLERGAFVVAPEKEGTTSVNVSWS